MQSGRFLVEMNLVHARIGKLAKTVTSATIVQRTKILDTALQHHYLCTATTMRAPGARSENSMADSSEASAQSAEKAYAEAAAEAKPAKVETAAIEATPAPAAPVVTKMAAEPKKPAPTSRKKPAAKPAVKKIAFVK